MIYREHISTDKEFLALVQETEDNGLIETILCDTYRDSNGNKGNIIAASARTDACPVGCKFCGLRPRYDEGFRVGRNLSSKEIYRQIENTLLEAERHSSFEHDAPLKIVFTKGSEMLLNSCIKESVEMLIEELYTPVKISTSFPESRFFRKNYEDLLSVVERHPDLIRLQGSLLSTNSEQRRSISGVDLFSYGDVSDMCKEFVNSGGRRPTITFTIGPDTETNANSFYQHFDPEIVAIRFRAVIPNSMNDLYCFNNENEKVNRLREIEERFSEKGYFIVPHQIETQTENSITAGYFIRKVML